MSISTHSLVLHTPQPSLSTAGSHTGVPHSHAWGHCHRTFTCWQCTWVVSRSRINLLYSPWIRQLVNYNFINTDTWWLLLLLHVPDWSRCWWTHCVWCSTSPRSSRSGHRPSSQRGVYMCSLTLSSIQPCKHCISIQWCQSWRVLTVQFQTE